MRRIAAHTAAAVILAPGVITVFNGNPGMMWVNLLGLAYFCGIYVLSSRTEPGRRAARWMLRYLS